MADPFSADALGDVVLTEGIKFLYEQAGEVLKRWRQRRDKDASDVHDARLRPPECLLDGTVKPVEPRDDYADRLAEDVRQARQLLADYADGIETPHPGDHLLLEQVNALRQLLEAVSGQPITFKGEQRQPSGPLVTGQIDVDSVVGDAAAVRARVINSGEIRGSTKAGVVEAGGKLTGVEIDQIGWTPADASELAVSAALGRVEKPFHRAHMCFCQTRPLDRLLVEDRGGKRAMAERRGRGAAPTAAVQERSG